VGTGLEIAHYLFEESYEMSMDSKFKNKFLIGKGNRRKQQKLMEFKKATLDIHNES
jgi:hypothetical protein